MYSVYIIESIAHERWYIGSAEDVLKRLGEHNRKRVRATKAYAPYRLVYVEKYETRAGAYNREVQLKKSGLLRRQLKDKLNTRRNQEVVYGPIV